VYLIMRVGVDYTDECAGYASSNLLRRVSNIAVKTITDHALSYIKKSATEPFV
jgi:hypothetical protein